MILDLCAQLHQVAEGKGCLGWLLARQKQQKYGLVAVKHHPSDPTSTSLIRLHDMLTISSTAEHEASSQCTSGKTPCLNDLWKRDTGIRIASSLLQLYNTPWLTNSWGRHDVYFVKRSLEAAGHSPPHPLFCRQLHPRSDASQMHSQKATRVLPIIRNKPVFDLGVLLIELWCDKPLQSMRSKEDLIEGVPNAMVDFLTAARLLNRVRIRAGAKIGDAIRRCIYCDFNKSDTSLENEEFCQAVFMDVVKPLMEDFDLFRGVKTPIEGVV